MQISDLVTQGVVLVNLSARSKKRAIELSAEAIGEKFPELPPAALFEALTERERLGSTAMGNGLAIPHCRLPESEQMEESSVVAVITLDQGIDYDAPDGKPVDLLFVMVVFGEANQQHLNTLAAVAEIYSDNAFCHKLRNAKNRGEVLELFERTTKDST